jgi:ATP synthase protein I
MNSDLKSLEQKIREAKHGKEQSETELSRIKKAQNNKMAMQAGYEFVASVLLSAILGYFIDQWLGTAPLFLISLFLLGTCAGFLSIFRISKNLGMSVGYSQLHRDEKEANKSPNNNEAHSNERTKE